MYKKIYILVVILLTVGKANAQVVPLNAAVEVSAYIDGGRERLSFNTHNKDFCDYYVRIQFLEANGFEGISHNQFISTTVGRGKLEIRTFKVKSHPFTYRYSREIYRGNITKKPNTDFIYALPVAVKDTVGQTVSDFPDERFPSIIYFSLPSDTLYACRGGVMCDDNLTDQAGRNFKPAGDVSQITLYHNDGSFSGYVFIGKPLVSAGQKINMGSPIAVIERYLDRYTVNFTAYYLDRNRTVSNSPYKHTYFIPYFQTANEGKTKLKTGGTYTCELTDEMKMEEMSKREKKKFTKNKQL